MLFIFFGIAFRISAPGNFGVGFDQVQILEKTNQIISGNLSLIGPRTGPANMFTGPLIYYLSVPFVLVFGNYLTVSLVPLLISTTTGIAIYWLMKKYIGKKEAFISLAIWSMSPFLISLDRVFWNPNLTLLSSFLIFIPLFKKRDDNLSLFLLFLGSFLSYQSHFSGLVFVFLALITLLFRKSIKQLISVTLGFLLSITPTIIFDVRNDFLNIRGLIGLLGEKGEFNIIALANDLLHNTYIIGETQGKLFLYGNSTELIISFGLLFIFTSIILVKKYKELKLPLVWLIFISLAYSFYGGEKPEYYFLITIPLLFMISTRIINLIKFDYQKVLLLLFISSSLLINTKLVSSESGMTVKNISEIHEVLSKQNVKSIIYDVPYGSDVGLKYFLSQIDLKSNGDIYHISYPDDLSFSGVRKISNLGLWKDERKESNNYVSKDNYFLETNNNILLYEDLYPKNDSQSFDSYILVRDNLVVGSLYIAEERNNRITWFSECQKQKEVLNYDWVANNNNKYFRYYSEHCMMLSQKDDFKIDANQINFW